MLIFADHAVEQCRFDEFVLPDNADDSASRGGRVGVSFMARVFVAAEAVAFPAEIEQLTVRQSRTPEVAVVVHFWRSMVACRWEQAYTSRLVTPRVGAPRHCGMHGVTRKQ
jgi:hypothetical protein